MSNIKIPYPFAKDILNLYQDHGELIQLSSPQMTPLTLIQLGQENGYFADVIKFMSHAFPVREAIWWGVCCGESLTHWNREEVNALEAAKNWVKNPDESSRRKAEFAAEKAGLETGAGWIAQAAFWSSGSMTKPDMPVAPPPPFLYAQAIAGGITLSAVLAEETLIEARFHDFINIGTQFGFSNA